jgi:hypothetical protein
MVGCRARVPFSRCLDRRRALQVEVAAENRRRDIARLVAGFRERERVENRLGLAALGEESNLPWSLPTEIKALAASEI